MADFTPSMERIRDDYVRMRNEHFGFTDLYAAEFDRALARHDANVRTEALREAADYWRSSQTHRADDAPMDGVERWLRFRADRIEAGRG